MPADARLLRACRCESTVENGDDRSEREDTSPAVRVTVPPCPKPKAPRSKPNGAGATDDRGYPRDEPDEAPVRPPSTVLRSTPNVQPSPFAEPLRAYPECNKSDGSGIYETGSKHWVTACYRHSSHFRVSKCLNNQLPFDFWVNTGVFLGARLHGFYGCLWVYVWV